jgi:heme exporter protein D
MELSERILWLAMGMALGFVLGYIVRSLREIKQKVSEVNKTVNSRTRDERGFMRVPFIADALMLVVLAVVAYSAFQTQMIINDQDDQAQRELVERCESGVDSRNVQRDMVEAIYELAIGVVSRDEDAPPRTPMQVAVTNAFIDRANAFREDAYDQIKPSEQCLPYVDDDDVEPRTPPAPHVK